MNDEFILYYQPKIDLASRQVCGAEALSRWNCPGRGFVLPDVFIPVAEQTNLMLPFTLWTLNLAARQFAGFHRLCGQFSVALNLSATILYDADVVDLISRTIKIWGIRPEQLILEVTESAMMVDPKSSLETLNRFHDFGIKLAIDDFGTGYSSLAYVKKLPVDELKIDKSFVMNMDKDKGDAMIVRTVIDMAHNFEIAVTAEGVESQPILEQLIDLGCEYAQGFHMARPMPQMELDKWLQESPWAKQTGPKAATG
jgi:EAL domain-containing protein (putative c-di-GMP-specific phosphodiesterase class I)